MCSGSGRLFLKSISIFYCSIMYLLLWYQFLHLHLLFKSISNPNLLIPIIICYVFIFAWNNWDSVAGLRLGLELGLRWIMGAWHVVYLLKICSSQRWIVVEQCHHTQHTRQGRRHSTRAKRIEYVNRKWVSFLRYWNDGPFSAHRQSSSIMDEKYLQ